MVSSRPLNTERITINAKLQTVMPAKEIPEIKWTTPDIFFEKKYLLAINKDKFNALRD